MEAGRAQTPGTIGSALVLLAVAGIAISRWPIVASPADRLASRNERRYYEWSYGRAGPEWSAEVMRLAPDLRDGDAVCVAGRVNERIDVPRDARWVLMMTTYFLPRQIVLAAKRPSTPTGPLCRRTLLLARPGRPAVLERHAPAADAR